MVAHRPFALDKLKDYIDELVELMVYTFPTNLEGLLHQVCHRML
ncbi:hypothetical protein [Methanobrevibacter sp.]|nr:hypothetical protein [Methanobrevibacter sp.]MDO5824345.1 hypothetical protein [Methanobrevibacter sp.]